MTQSISNMSQVWMSNTNTYNSIAMSVSTLGAGANVNSRLLTLKVDGSTKFDIDADGRVGVGTNNPSLYASPGQVVNYNSGTAAFWTVGGNVSSYLFSSNTGQVSAVGTSSNHPFTLYTNGAERMRIGATGDVFIGNATDAGNTLRYFDIQNINTGSSAGAIIRLITSNASGSGVTTVDIVKYKNGNFVINNNDPAGIFSLNNAGAERMRIDSSGRITTPNQPTFSAYHQHTATPGVVTNTWGSWNSNITNWSTPRWFAETNIGSSFNTSNGIFTAPIAGRYFITIGMSGDFRNTAYLGFWRNGALASPLGLTFEANGGSGSTFYNQLTSSFIFNLAANDTITGACYFAAPSTGTTTLVYNGYTFIAGYLIG